MLRKLSVIVAVVTLVLAGRPVPDAFAELTIIQSEGSAKVSLEFFGTGLPGGSDQETFGPFGGVAVAELGRLRAVQTGSGLNAVTAVVRASDVPSFFAQALTNIDVTVQNTGGATESLVFDYLINGGELRLFDPRGSFDGLVASVDVSIFTIGASDVNGFLWLWNLTLRGIDDALTVDVNILADPLNLGLPDLSAITVTGGEALLSIAPFTASVDLGDLSRGGTVFVTYDMSATVSGPGLSLTGGEATIGDPFGFEGNPGSVFSFRGVNPGTRVPAPPAVILLVLGALAALRGRRASRR